MKVTNTSDVIMHVRGADGVRPIGPGRSVNIEFTDEQLARARGRTFITIEEEPKVERSAKPAGKKRPDAEKAVPVAEDGA